jgi:hypothetical protein
VTRTAERAVPVQPAALQQRFWEAQLAVLSAGPTGSVLLDMLAVADRRAVLLRLARAGREWLPHTA